MMNTVGRIAGPFCSFGALVVTVICGIHTAEAKVGQSTFVTRVRSAETIMLGVVSEVQEKKLYVNVGKVLKGSISENSIAIQRPNKVSEETSVAQYAVGENVLVFHANTGFRFVSKLEMGAPADYVAAVNTIIEYDVAVSTKQKKSLLIGMLRGNNRVLHQAALLDLMYLDRRVRSNDADNDDLLPFVEGLARKTDDNTAELAIRVIGRMGSRKSIPVLIGLVDIGNAARAEVAVRVLNGKFGERKNSKSEWKDWWESNKGKYK